MKESEYVSYLKKKYLKETPKAVFYKIPDSFGVDGKTRPYDYYTFNQGDFEAVEAKIHKETSPFYFREVKPHQVFNLRKVLANWGYAWVSIGIRARTNKKFRKKYDYDYAWFKADVWINVEYLPGDDGDIGLLSLDVPLLFNVVDVFEGSKVNEIYLSEGDLDKVTRKHIINLPKDRAAQATDADRVFGGEKDSKI